MENIKEHLFLFIKKRADVTDNEIEVLFLSDYMDSLDIVDLVLEIEDEYNVEIDEKFSDKLPDMRLSEIINYIEQEIIKRSL